MSPHEFMQAVMSCSKKRFIIEKQSDPVEFFSWLLNTLHFDLTGGKPKKHSIITQCFQVGDWKHSLSMGDNNRAKRTVLINIFI